VVVPSFGNTTFCPPARNIFFALALPYFVGYTSGSHSINVKVTYKMFQGILNKNVFLSIVCQQSRAGQGVTGRWATQMLGCTKPSALATLDGLVDTGELERVELPWRSNANIHYYTPTKKTWEAYHSKQFRDDYLLYMRSMVELD